MTTNYSCSDKAEAARRYYYTHRDAINARNRERYATDPEYRAKVLAAAHRYRKNNIAYVSEFDRIRGSIAYYKTISAAWAPEAIRKLEAEKILHQMSKRNRKQPMKKTRLG